MNNKHTAVFVALGLIAVFVVLAIWYAIAHRESSPIPTNTATTTPTAGVEAPAGHLSDVGKYYDAKAAYPSATPLLATAGATANAEAVLAMKNFAQKNIDSFKDNGNFANLTAEDIKVQGLDKRKYTLGMSYKMYTGMQTVSYVFTMNEDTLGAHPNTYFRTFTFDTKSGQWLELGDLFVEASPYLERISKETRADLPIILNMKSGMPADADMIKNGTYPDIDSFLNFAIDGDTLQIIFPPYQVAAYVFGAVIDPIKLSKLSDILKPVYIP